MKTLRLKTLVLPALMAVVPLSALATDPPDTGREEHEIINAQFAVTHGFVNAVIKDAGHADRDGNTPLPQDYLDASDAFNGRLDKVLANFEAEVRDNVVTPLAPAIAKFNRLMRMKMSPDQAEMIIKQNFPELQATANQYATAYQTAIERVYHFLDLPLDPKIETSKIRAADCPETTDSDFDYQRFKRDKATGAYKVGKEYNPVEFKLSAQTAVNQHSFEVAGCEFSTNYGPRYVVSPGPQASVRGVGTNDNRIQITPAAMALNGFLSEKTAQAYQTLVFPAVSDGCQVLPCVALRAADLAHTLESIRAKIDQALVIPLFPCGQPDHLERNYGERCNAITIAGSSRDVETLVQAIKRVDYPKEFVARAAEK
jgi:hypothetical protein